MADPERSIDERILATLEEILAIQREVLGEYRRVNAEVAGEIKRSVALQAEGAERGKQALKTQRAAARLYRIVLVVAAAVVGFLLFLLWRL